MSKITQDRLVSNQDRSTIDHLARSIAIASPIGDPSLPVSESIQPCLLASRSSTFLEIGKPVHRRVVEFRALVTRLNNTWVVALFIIDDADDVTGNNRFMRTLLILIRITMSRIGENVVS